MQLQLIRNATLRLTYGGHLILIDPYLAPQFSLRSLAGKSKNPTVELPCTPQEAVAGVEMTIVSHLHADHFDSVAWEVLAKEIPLFCQPGDETTIAEKGFQDVRVIQDSATWAGISLTRTPGRHGTSQEWADKMGNVSGFVLRATGEPTIYWTGDTIWYEPVAEVIAREKPDIIITHSCGAAFAPNDPIVMDAAHTIAVCKAAPDATIIAVHMDALDHATVSRADLRSAADAAGISQAQLLIPADGEKLTL